MVFGEKDLIEDLLKGNNMNIHFIKFGISQYYDSELIMLHIDFYITLHRNFLEPLG